MATTTMSIIVLAFMFGKSVIVRAQAEKCCLVPSNFSMRYQIYDNTTYFPFIQMWRTATSSSKITGGTGILGGVDRMHYMFVSVTGTESALHMSTSNHLDLRVQIEDDDSDNRLYTLAIDASDAGQKLQIWYKADDFSRIHLRRVDGLRCIAHNGAPEGGDVENEDCDASKSSQWWSYQNLYDGVQFTRAATDFKGESENELELITDCGLNVDCAQLCIQYGNDCVQFAYSNPVTTCVLYNQSASPNVPANGYRFYKLD